MRVVCSVMLVNRAAARQGCSPRNSRKVRSTVSLYKKGGEVCLMWCTVKNKHGTSYKLKNNIEKTLSRLSSEGKVTVQFKNPEVDLLISDASPVDLGRFMSAITIYQKGGAIEGMGLLSTTEPVQNKVIKKPVTKLKISEKQMLPTTKGYPRTLQELTVCNVGLKKLDSRILKLMHLSYLSLIGNAITDLPNEVTELPLAVFDISNNKLTRLPTNFCEVGSKLCKTLKFLNLHANEIERLPQNIGNLEDLHRLDVSKNCIRFLPVDMGRLKSLRLLHASQNQILFIPTSFKKLSLEQIDLSDNDINSRKRPINRLSDMRSLEDIAANFIVRNNISFDESELNPACRLKIKLAKKCIFCPNYVFRNYIRIFLKFNLHCISAHVTHSDKNWRSSVPLDVYICSKKCFYSKHQHPTWPELPEPEPDV